MELFEQIATLQRERQAFVLATVVARRPPVSAHLGDRAIVFADGRMEGFVGGACSQEIIRRQALDALRTRQPRLVSIGPDPSSRADGGEHVTVRMTCVSEGAIDVYVEPFVQPRRLIVVGATPVAEAVTRLARGMDYDVVRFVSGGELRDVEAGAASIGASAAAIEDLPARIADGAASGAEQAAVVASQGHYDEEALNALLRHGLFYVGLVASRRRAATGCETLAQTAVPNIETIRNPAGIDLGARTAVEVALSILAEIVQIRPTGVPAAGDAPPAVEASTATPVTAVDPVCGMVVTVATARHTAVADGVAYHFCCANCRSRFLEDPRRFLAAS